MAISDQIESRGLLHDTGKVSEQKVQMQRQMQDFYGVQYIHY